MGATGAPGADPPPPRGDPCHTKCLETTTLKLASPSTPEFKNEQFHMLLSD